MSKSKSRTRKSCNKESLRKESNLLLRQIWKVVKNLPKTIVEHLTASKLILKGKKLFAQLERREAVKQNATDWKNLNAQEKTKYQLQADESKKRAAVDYNRERKKSKKKTIESISSNSG